MKLRQLRLYSDKLLKGKLSKALLVCLMPIGADTVFKLAEAAIYCVMLYFEELTPLGLFSGENAFQLAAAIICTALRYIASAPLSFAAAVWFVRMCSEKRLRQSSLARIILSPDNFARSFSALLLSKAAAFIFVIPVFVFGRITAGFLSGGIGNSEGFQLLMTVHAAVMTLVSAVLWLSAKLSLSSVPFLLVSLQENNAFHAVRCSFVFMNNRKLSLLKILAVRFLQMLPVVTVPFVLPKLYTDVYLFFSICLREDEYHEGNKIYRDKPKTHNASELPYWTNGSLPPSADKA